MHFICFIIKFVSALIILIPPKMKKCFLFLFMFVVANTFAQTQTEKYSRIKIYADESGIIQLAQAGLAVDHGEMKKGFWFISDFSATEIAIVKAKGFSYDIVIDDVKQFYKDQNNPGFHKTGSAPSSIQSIGCSVPPSYVTPSNFTLGSMGGFFTYAEILWHLDNLATLFPSIVKAKTQIGANTIEGRPIYWMKISDNPNTDETTEPEVFYNSAHHAREPASVSQLIMYMYYLCENYATNPEVQYLVNNEEMYFIPLANPDGYVYNETTNPSGGGMWRKNRRNNGDGTMGVDLNRNYGYNWGYDNIGSSPNGWSEVYRGIAAFSEIECQNERDFCNAHGFKLTLNNHTYGNLLIYPWGFGAPFYTPDSAQFAEYGEHLTTYNKYAYGTDIQTVLYSTNGTIDDWEYGEQGTKPKILGMTPEAGRTDEGFWPPASRVIDICKENIWENLHLAHLALKFAIATDDQANYIPATSGYFNYKLKRLGMDAPGTYTVSIIPIGTTISSVGAPKTYSTLNLLQEVDDSIAYTLNAIAQGATIQYEIDVNNGSYTFKDTITKKFGTPVIVFSSDGNSMTGWTSPSWGLSTTNFHSGTASITDSPVGDYTDNATSSISTSTNLDLTDAISAQLVFWSRWEIETNYDYAQALVSTDNGATWGPLCGHLTKTGNAYQDFGNPLYDAYKLGWEKEEMSLDNYIGMNVKVGFQLVADNGGIADGFYFDDLKVEKLLPAGMGINDLNETGISLFQNMPNPANDYTYINYVLPKGEKATLQVYNCFGQMVLEKKVDGSGSYLLNTTKLAQGVYYYNLKTASIPSQSLRLSIVR